MKEGIVSTRSFAGSAGLISLIYMAGMGLAQAQVVQKAVIVFRADQDKVRASVRSFDSREQRLGVKPLEWYENAPASTAREVQSATGPKTEGRAAGSLPAPGANKTARAEFAEDWKSLGEVTGPEKKDFIEENSIDFGTKGVFTAYPTPYSPGASPAAGTPWRAVGKLYFAVASGGSATCTATVISPKNVIVTAAHCVFDRSVQKFNGSFTFVPAEYNGNAPYGAFTYVSGSILNAWPSGGARKDDVAVLKLGNNQAGRPVTYYTGSLGRSWDYSSVQSMHSIGYPGNIGNSLLQQLCAAETLSPPAACGGTTVLNMGCNMTYGASGGPWIRSYRSSNYVSAVVSGYDNTSCTGTFGTTFNSGRFTSSNIVPLCTTIGC